MIESTKERGKFKQRIKNMLFGNPDLVSEVTMTDTSNMTAKEKVAKFNEVVKSHLFIDGTLTEKCSFIFYDVICPDISAQTKECKVILFAICHVDLLDNYQKEGYYGNRADILSEMVEETLLNEENAKQFGIGSLILDRVDIYNTESYYGVQMLFEAECFR